MKDVNALAESEGRRLYGNLSDGTPVFSKKAGMADHLANHADVLALLDEAFEKLSMADFDGRNMLKAVEMGRVVGISKCVPTDGNDTVVYRRRKGRDLGCTRFVIGKEGVECSTVVVILYLNEDGLVAIMTAYIGALAPPEPATPTGQRDLATYQRACEFWRNRALCWEGEEAVEPEEYRESDYFGTPPSATPAE